MLDAASNITIEGFDRYNFSTLMGMDGPQLPLRWGGGNSTAGGAKRTYQSDVDGEGEEEHDRGAGRNTTMLAGRRVRFRFGFRDATLYALVLEG